MGLEPMKTSAETEFASSIPDYFYSAASVTQSERYSWLMEDLGRVEAELKQKQATLAFRFQLVIKRLFDIAVSFVLIVLLAPVFLLTAAAVKLTSPGPVMYSQKRWGRDQKHFICLKFRSMFIDQHKILEQSKVKEIENAGVLIKLKEDPRLTIIGSLIRKTSIDELPQLFNVLKGDMSLVGPRPLVLHMMQPYPAVRRVRCTMAPGVTGLWQIRDRGNNTMVLGMMPHDLEYLTNFSVLLDIKILLATLPAVLWGTGAC